MIPQARLSLLERVLFVSLASFFVLQAGADPLITEFMADNATTLADEDGAFPDWVEVHNPAGVAVDMDGYYLTDNAGSPTKWRFPAVSIEPGGFLVVFASGKDRAVAGSELHTNFKLSAGGEYLALVGSDGVTVLNDFSPSYPGQDADRSFGVAFDGVPLLSEGATAKYFVPGNGALGTSWTGTGFSDGSWSSGATGLGFGLQIPGMTLREIHSSGSVSSLANVDSLLAGSGVASETTAIVQTYNHLDTGADGHYGNNQVFPGGGGDDFIGVVTGTLVIPTAGTWTFGLNSDDGGRIRIGGADVMVDDTLHGARDFLGTTTLAAGAHSFEAVFFERGGGAECEFFAAPGSFGTWNSGFRLVGDVAGGGLAVFTSPDGAGGGGGSAGAIATDISAGMRGVRASAYVRLPFSVSDPGALDSLSLSMRYNDGFVAYVNGTQVAARNAPGSLAWNSSATAARDGADSLVAEAINLTAAIPGLQAGGGNILAIHGLNVSAADDSFLVLPELTGGGLAAGAPVYFDGATPGSINSTPSSLGKVADTKFTPDRGFYPNAANPVLPLSVEIATLTEGAVIRYTTDGSEPSATNGTVYSGPITVNGTTTLRAIATKTGYDSTNIDTHTYLVVDDVITQSQSAPAGWPGGSVNGQVFDYGMDPDIVNSGNPAIGGVAEVKLALTAIPTISIVTEQANLTSSGTGIYTHAGSRGFAWERASSAELLFPEGYVDPDGNTKGFQIDAGLRVRGGFSRSNSNPKHALRLFFRAEYGDSKLRYPMFGEDGVSEFDNLDLRTSQNYSWAFQNDTRNTFLREVFSRDTQRDMGVPHTRSRYYHVYLNGIYWGLYMTQERAEASYAESYFGGNKEDWDVVKSAGSSGGYTSEVTDGFFDDWAELWQMGRNLVDAGFGGDRAAEYYKMQGLNPDGTRNLAYPVLLDLDNLIDYMMVTFWVGNFDAPLSNFLGNDRPNNWFGMRNRTDPDRGFIFFAHDAEHSMFSGWDRTGPWNSGNRANVSYSNPQFLHEDLLQNRDLTTRREYQMRWADRVQQHMFGSGVLTPAVARARVEARAATVDRVIIAESARWGDAKGANPPRDRNTWVGARNNLLNSYLPGRNSVVLGQFRGDGLYPQTAAPTLSQDGGYIGSTDQLSMAATGGTIYYYTDGQDPRLPGGGLNGSPPIFVGSTTTTTFVNTGASWRYLDDGSNQGTAWRANGFADGGWKTGDAELGYGDTQDTVIGFGGNSGDKHVTSYFRKTFTVADAGSFDTLTVELQRDDGGVVYLNGELVFSSNMPASYDYQTPALGVVGGADENALFSNAVDPGLLVNGTNTVAVEIHQYYNAGQTVTSSDISFDLRLRGTKTTSSNPVNLSGPGEVTVKTRARSGSDWSAVNVATFYVDLVPASPANLAITEISYRPAAPTAAELTAGFNDRDDFEFIELTNASGDNVHLRDVAFTDGIDFNFSDAATGLVLLPGERVLLVRNAAAFEFRYGVGLPVAGEFSGGLNNDGEQLVLSDAAGDAIHDLTFNDQLPWPTAADGDGFSLVLVMPDGAAVPDHGDAQNWRASVGAGGSPGVGDGTSYVVWKAAESVSGDSDDRDGDGLDAVAEYALGGDPDRPDAENLPTGSVESLDVGGVVDDYLVIRVRRRAGADDLGVTVELGDDLIDGGWSEVPVSYVGVEKNADGSETLIFRSADPAGAAISGKAFLRVRFGV